MLYDFLGEPAGIRTRDPLIKSQMLYRLSYRLSRSHSSRRIPRAAQGLRGNLTADGFSSLGYDAENRLVTAAGARNASLVYAPSGQLFQTSGGGLATYFLHGGDVRVHRAEPRARIEAPCRAAIAVSRCPSLA